MKLKEFFSNNTMLKVISLLLAFAAWLIVVENVDREAFSTIKDVTINMNTVEDSISTLGLNSITPDVEQATVSVSGIMYAVGNLSKEDIEVVPDISRVTGAGVYELPLIGRIKNASNDKEVQVTSVTPSRITVKFDTLHTKILDIGTNLNGIRGQAGYLIQDELVTPSTVSITGPEAEVSRVSRCEVRLSVDEKLSETYSKKADLVLLDKDGNVVEPVNITMDAQQATVTIPVLKIREVPVQLQFMNVPKNFPVEDLDFLISSKTIKVAGPKESVDKYAAVVLDHIDFKQLSIGSTFAFNVKLPAGFWNVENIRSVQVSLNSRNMTTKKFNLEDIRVINVPLGYKAEAMAKQLTDVEIIGDADALEKLAAGDIIAEVDLRESSDIETGQVLLPVKVYVPNGDLAWARGSYEVVVSISEKTADEEPKNP